MITDRFCEKCGAALIIHDNPTGRFDTKTGKEETAQIITCPQYKTNWLGVSSGHYYYDETAPSMDEMP